MELNSFWAKSQPFQSVVTHGIVSGTVCRYLMTEYLSAGSRDLVAGLLGLTDEELLDFTAYLASLHNMLYGVCHAAIVSMGFSPGLGFIHTGKQLSFVYDLADLYKTETAIPAAFEAVAKGGDVHKELRSLCRKYFGMARLMERIPKDLAELFDGMEGGVNALSAGSLWSEDGELEGGKNYGGGA